MMVALSYYDYDIVSSFSCGQTVPILAFCDVALIRKSGDGYVGYKVLFAVSDTLAKFMNDNENVVLCFYCDANSDVRRNHNDIPPQEYRSQLFSRMFELYVKSRNLSDYINHRIEIEDSENCANRQFAHFICHKKYESVVTSIGQVLMQK